MSMQYRSKRSIASALLCVGLGLASMAARADDTQQAVSLSVENVSAKVGERAVLVARITPRNGYQIADAYRNRITTLSAGDDGVEIDSKLVRGAMQDGSLVFRIPVTATKPGTHPINGVIRFGFVTEIAGERHLDLKWEPLMATVTGTE